MEQFHFGLMEVVHEWARGMVSNWSLKSGRERNYDDLPCLELKGLFEGFS